MQKPKTEHYDRRTDPVIGRIQFQGRDILEIGCGAGAFTLEHLTRARTILCLDPKAEAIDDLKAQWIESAQSCPLDARPGKIEEFSLPEDSFDMAVFSHSL